MKGGRTSSEMIILLIYRKRNRMYVCMAIFFSLLFSLRRKALAVQIVDYPSTCNDATFNAQRIAAIGRPALAHVRILVYEGRIIEVGFGTGSNRPFRTKSLEGNAAGIADMRSVFMVRKWASVRSHNAGVTTIQRGQRQRQQRRRQRRDPTRRQDEGLPSC